MQPGISTYVFLPERLHAGLLDTMYRAGARAIEIFAARHHFDYTDRAALGEFRSWFEEHAVRASLHAPVSADPRWSRHVAPTLNLIDVEKSRRITAMDETKRALEAAERIPFAAMVLHLGMRDDRWNTRTLEHSITAIEHLKAFASPLGVKLLLENTQNEVTTPEHLLEIVRVGHFDDVSLCLDVGHAHLTDYKSPGAGIDAAFELIGDRIAELHLHDNNGARDEHLWPGTASSGLNWTGVEQHLNALPPWTPGVLEISYELGDSLEQIVAKSSAAFDRQLRATEQAEIAAAERVDGMASE